MFESTDKDFKVKEPAHTDSILDVLTRQAHEQIASEQSTTATNVVSLAPSLHLPTGTEQTIEASKRRHPAYIGRHHLIGAEATSPLAKVISIARSLDSETQ